MGQEVTNAVLAVLNSGMVPPQLNHTFLTLIPKIHSPRKVTDFRPISLSNVLVEGHLWKAQWKEKPKDDGHSKLTMNS